MKPNLLDNVAAGRWSNEIAEAAAKRRPVPGAIHVRDVLERKCWEYGTLCCAAGSSCLAVCLRSLVSLMCRESHVPRIRVTIKLTAPLCFESCVRFILLCIRLRMHGHVLTSQNLQCLDHMVSQIARVCLLRWAWWDAYCKGTCAKTIATVSLDHPERMLQFAFTC
jgi:hypothetical protein